MKVRVLKAGRPQYQETIMEDIEIELNEFFLEEAVKDLLSVLTAKNVDRKTWARNVILAEDILYKTLTARKRNRQNFRVLHDLT